MNPRFCLNNLKKRKIHAEMAPLSKNDINSLIIYPISGDVKASFFLTTLSNLFTFFLNDLAMLLVL